MIIKNEDHGSSVTGTHLQGYIECSYDDLVNTFGTPTIEGGVETKIEVEWELTFYDPSKHFDEVQYATVYNWKTVKDIVVKRKVWKFKILKNGISEVIANMHFILLKKPLKIIRIKNNGRLKYNLHCDHFGGRNVFSSCNYQRTFGGK